MAHKDLHWGRLLPVTLTVFSHLSGGLGHFPNLGSATVMKKVPFLAGKLPLCGMRKIVTDVQAK